LRKEGGHLLTLEIDEGRAKLARANFSAAGLDSVITLNPTSTLFPMILAKAGEHAAELLCFQCGLAKTSRIVTNYYRGVLT
jgi:predicted O-methyltransferase YrrM